MRPVIAPVSPALELLPQIASSALPATSSTLLRINVFHQFAFNRSTSQFQDVNHVPLCVKHAQGLLPKIVWIAPLDLSSTKGSAFSIVLSGNLWELLNAYKSFHRCFLLRLKNKL